MEDVNRFGLKRSDLTVEIKRTVRRRCGFGCINCGSAIFEYHHFDPPFEDAEKHRPDGITLLCGGCHGNVTRGVWSPDFVRRMDANPYSNRGRPHVRLDVKRPLRMILGSVVLLDVDGPAIKIDDEVILGLHSDDEEGVLIDARFFDDAGSMTVEVRRNELLLSTNHWDATFIGRKIKVSNGPRETVFEAKLHPPYALVVRRMNISLRGSSVRTDDTGRVWFAAKSGGLVDLENYCCVTRTCVHLNDGAVQFNGPHAQIPYPGTRLRRFVRAGRIDHFLSELFEPAVHVAPFRDARRPLPPIDTLRLEGAPAGKTRYRRLCEVCNETGLGHRDVPDDEVPTYGLGFMCEACAALPPDAWRVTGGRGEELSRYKTIDEARNAAVDLCRRNLPSHVIVHAGKRGVGFIFPADEAARAGG